VTVPAPDVLRAEIDRRLAVLHDADPLVGSWAGAMSRERGYLTALRTILNEHDDEIDHGPGCRDHCWLLIPIAAALIREDQ